jgi:hypothetical protein
LRGVSGENLSLKYGGCDRSDKRTCYQQLTARQQLQLVFLESQFYFMSVFEKFS